MTVKCLKGSKSLGLQKGRIYPVMDVFQMGPDYGHQTRILIQKQDRQQVLYVPNAHKHHLALPSGFNVNRGNPTNKAKMAFINFDWTKVRKS